MCFDYQQLNSNTVVDAYPLPHIDKLLLRLDGAKVFSKLDLCDGYHQLPIAKDDQLKTAFTTRYGTFQWTVMPFGLCNAPSTFQRVMNQVFFMLLDHSVVVYLDDILIYSHTIAAHCALLKEVFALLAKYQLHVKESKCHLFLSNVEFLGYLVDSRGITMQPGKVVAIKEWVVPMSINEVQQFLGLANYYRRFIFRFSELASPLTRLTRKEVKFGQTSARSILTP